MSTEAGRAAQRAAWKQALAAAARTKRQQRGKRAAGTRVRAGMNRIAASQDQLNDQGDRTT